MGKIPSRLKYWQEFLEWFGRDETYWYFPKGRSVQAEGILESFRVLKGFEGSTWRESQIAFLDELENKGLFSRKATGQSEQDATAMARMYKSVYQFLGLAWVEDDENIAITPAGNAYLSANDPKTIIQKQIQRYQIYNPTQRSKSKDYTIRPHIFLLDVLLNVGLSISNDEYVLFISRAKNDAEIDRIVEWILRWRQLSLSEQEIIKSLAGELHDFNGRRTSLINTINLNRAYAMQFLSFCDYLERPSGSNIAVKMKISDRFEVEALVRRYRTEAVFIEFSTEKDWFSYFGDHEKFPSKAEATDYYIDSSQPEKLEDVNASREAIDAQISEKILEDFLEKNLDKLEVGLTLVGRQYPTITGPIDLLCKDRDGNWVVLELKKGRASDRVVGQLMRYIGFVRQNMLENEDQIVRGIIVSKSVDKNLEMSVAGVGSKHISVRTFSANVIIN